MGWLGRRWRWFGSHDPISIVAVALIPHRALVGWATLISFLVFVVLEQTRANVVTTLWGVIGAGLVVSVILAEQGERIQRRVWLRENAVTVGDFLNRATATVGIVGLLGVGVPEPIRQRVMFGKDRADRTLASAEARTIIQRFSEAPPVALANLPYEYGLLSDQLGGLTHLMDGHDSILSRMTPVLGSLQRWKSIALMVLGVLPNQDLQVADMFFGGNPARRRDDNPVAREMRRGVFTTLAEATLDACERCSDLLEEGGLLPSGASVRNAERKKAPG